jgi:hypothetical protein
LKINNASYDIIPELNSLLNNLKFYHIEKIITSFKQFQSQNFKITNDNYKQEILGNYYEIVMEIIENINLNDVEKKKEDIEKDIENVLRRLENENKINRA